MTIRKCRYAKSCFTERHLVAEDGDCRYCVLWTDAIHQVFVRRSSEQQLDKARKVATPDHPRMRSGCFNLRMVDSFGVEPRIQFPVDGNEAVVGAARDPEEPNLRICI